MTNFAAVIDVATLDGTNGTTFVGEGGRAGTSVAFGDINGDGVADLLIGAPGSSLAYVVFGKIGDWGASTDLAGIGGANGFTISLQSLSWLGYSLASAGDVNGDGVTDFLIGAPLSRNGVGTAYLVMGHTGDWGSSVDLGSLNGANGGVLGGSFASGYNGFSVSGAGDLNGDGFADIIVGVPHPHQRVPGDAYVVFGKAGGIGSLLVEADLNGADGFRIPGIRVRDTLGGSVTGAGDVNGDGMADLIVGAPLGGSAYHGVAYVVFGGATLGASGSVDGDGLDGSNGFRLIGAASSESAYSVAGVGDINGDHIADIAVTGGAGRSYVVFGSRGGFSGSIYLPDLNGGNGFSINAGGTRVASAGDINGDGIGDLIVSDSPVAQMGNAYVLFGKSSGFSAAFDVNTLNGQNGFKIAGAGSSIAAGDFNGDGFGDLAVGDSHASSNGVYAAGAVYVIYGHLNVPVTVNWVGSGADETQSGGGFSDTLSGGGGKDVLNGLGGDDTLNGDDGNDTLSGGDGTDLLNGGAGNDILNGDDGDDALNGDDGADKLYGGGGGDHLNGGAGADQLYGGDGADMLNGGADNDLLDGGAGADAMTGGTGNDVYYVDDAGDTTVELSGEGTDIVRAMISWTLSANVEQLELQGSGNLDGTGNALGNRLAGNGGSNTLSGLAGTDTIDGGAGNDRIVGGTGNDLMTGGLGADTFVVLAESVYSSKVPAGRALEVDFVYDLKAIEGDRLDLSAIDANTATVADDAFHLIGAFSKHAGEMTLAYSASSNQTLLSLDIDGDGKADYQMKITGDVHLDSGGWIL